MAAGVQHRMIVRETIVSILINMALSAAFFVVVFGTGGPIATAALGRDCIPQAFMVCLMGSLVPGLLVGKRIGEKRLLPVVTWAIIAAGAAAALVGGAAWALGAWTDTTLSYAVALTGKVALGGLLAAAATPSALVRLTAWAGPSPAPVV